MRRDTFEFRCPKCKGKVRKTGKVYMCETCSAKWPIHGEIPCFNTHSFYWNQVPKEKMGKLLEIAKTQGWKHALDKVLSPLTDEYTFNYAIDESRADWHFMLPVRRGGRVLSLECGWGATTIPLARYYDVVGTDSTLETLEFLKIRAAQEGLGKLQLVRVDPLDYGALPFPGSSFDLVVMNGVLEWVGTSRTDIPPDRCQKTALKEIRRVLKPGGGIYIGTENRFSYTVFLGAKEHGKIPCTDLRSRRLAKRPPKLSGKKRKHRTYIHGYGGYKKMLRETGFHEVKFYFPLPSYREPVFMFSEDDTNAMEFFIRNKMIRSTLRRTMFAFSFYLHAVKLFIYSYGIFARARK